MYFFDFLLWKWPFSLWKTTSVAVFDHFLLWEMQFLLGEFADFSLNFKFLLEKRLVSGLVLSWYETLALLISLLDRKETMPIQRTFSDVFGQYLEQDNFENLNSGWESLLEPAGLSQLIGILMPIKFTQPYLYRYKSTPRLPHLLNEEQTLAFENLNLYQTISLHPGFYERELKSAYRAALLKTHPDQGGSAETFQQVRKSYEILASFVTK